MDVSVNVLKKIEARLERIEAKIDNFLGIEEVGKKELAEIKAAKKEIRGGNYVSLHDLKKKLAVD